MKRVLGTLGLLCALTVGSMAQTHTAPALDVASTFTAVQTFSAGLSLGSAAQLFGGLSRSGNTTTKNKLVIIDGSGKCAQPTTQGTKIIGIEDAGTGSAGNCSVAVYGTHACIFDNAVTYGDYVQANLTDGSCHSAGSTQPNNGSDIVGISLASGGAGTYNILVAPAFGDPATGASNRILIDKLAGADFTAKLAAGVLLCNSMPCVLDATGFITTQTCSALTKITNPNTTLLLPNVTISISFVTDSTHPCVWMAGSGNRIVGMGDQTVFLLTQAGSDVAVRVANSGASNGTALPILSPNDAVEGSNTLTFSAGNFTAMGLNASGGDYLALKANNPPTSNAAPEQLVRTLSATTPTVTLDGVLYDSFYTSAGVASTASRIVGMVIGAVVKDLKIDCGSITGATGLRLDTNAESEFSGLTIANCPQGSLESYSYGSKYHDWRIINSGTLLRAAWNAVGLTAAQVSNINVESRGLSGAFNAVNTDVHGSTFSGFTIDGGNTSGRGFRFTRSSHNTVANSIINNVGTDGGTGTGFKLEYGSHNNIFTNIIAKGNHQQGILISDGSRYNTFNNLQITHSTGNQVEVVVDFTRMMCRDSASPCSNSKLSLTMGTTGAGVNTVTRSSTTWPADCTVYNCVGMLVRFTGFVNGANNATWFKVTAMSADGLTMTIADPSGVTVAEGPTANVTVKGYLQDDFNTFNGGTIGFQRGTGTHAMRIIGNGWSVQQINFIDDNSSEADGISFNNQSQDGITLPTGSGTGKFTNQGNSISGNNFNLPGSTGDILMSTVSSTNVSGNTITHGLIRSGETAQTNFYANNPGDLPATFQRLTADSSSIVATTAATAVTQFSFAAIPPNVIASFHCSGSYIQATANAAVGMAIQGGTNAPTNLSARGQFSLSATTLSGADSGNITTTTYTSVAAPTSTNFGNVFPWSLDGTIEVGASASTLNIGFYTGNASDAVTIKRGSYCSLLPIS